MSFKRPPPPGAPAPLLITAHEVALLMGVTRQTVLAMQKRGELPQPAIASNNGGTGHRWNRKEILQFLREPVTT